MFLKNFVQEAPRAPRRPAPLCCQEGVPLIGVMASALSTLHSIKMLGGLARVMDLSCQTARQGEGVNFSIKSEADVHN